MARSKKVRNYVEVIKQLRSARKNVSQLEKKAETLFNDLSSVERQEYQRLAHEETLEDERSKDLKKRQRVARDLGLTVPTE